MGDGLGVVADGVGDADGVDVGEAEGVDLGEADGVDLGEADGVDLGVAGPEVGVPTSGVTSPGMWTEPEGVPGVFGPLADGWPAKG